MARTQVLAKAPCKMSAKKDPRRMMNAKSLAIAQRISRKLEADAPRNPLRSSSKRAQTLDEEKMPRATSSRAMARTQLRRSVKREKITNEPRQPPMAARCDVEPANINPKTYPPCPAAIRKPKARPRSSLGQTAPINPCATGPSAAPTAPATARTMKRPAMPVTQAVASVSKPHASVVYMSKASLHPRSATTPQTSTATECARASTSTIAPRDTGVAPASPSSSALKTPGSIAPSAACIKKMMANMHCTSWKLVRPDLATSVRDVAPASITGMELPRPKRCRPRATHVSSLDFAAPSLAASAQGTSSSAVSWLAPRLIKKSVRKRRAAKMPMARICGEIACCRSPRSMREPSWTSKAKLPSSICKGCSCAMASFANPRLVFNCNSDQATLSRVRLLGVRHRAPFISFAASEATDTMVSRRHARARRVWSGASWTRNIQRYGLAWHRYAHAATSCDGEIICARCQL
mmetsp:Transcript_20618/g.57382  ORF Transcript_20618/g.57382 Transcript_20618/m.57382 type:complete len:465 (-) Transcript_20618:37-1431(-)